MHHHNTLAENLTANLLVVLVTECPVWLVQEYGSGIWVLLLCVHVRKLPLAGFVTMQFGSN